MRVVSGVLRAWCWLGLAASVLAANGPGQGGHPNGSPSGKPRCTESWQAGRDGREPIRKRTTHDPHAFAASDSPDNVHTPFAVAQAVALLRHRLRRWRFRVVERRLAIRGRRRRRLGRAGPARAAGRGVHPGGSPHVRGAFVDSALATLVGGSPRASSSPVGKLRLEIQPPTAQVYVDGFYVGWVDTVNGAGGLKVTAGWHRVEFRASGYQTPAVNVTIEPNRTVVLRLALRPIP